MDTEAFLAYAGRKDSPGILGTPRKMDLNPFRGIGPVLGANLWRNVYYQKASWRRWHLHWSLIGMQEFSKPRRQG